MALTVTYDGVDLTSGNYHTLATSAPYRRAPARSTITPYALSPRGGRLSRPPGLLTVPVQIRIDGNRADGTLESRLDTINKLFSREGRRLVFSMQDSRWVTASWRQTGDVATVPNAAILSGEFLAEESYWQAASMSGDVQTAALSTLLLQGFETGAAFGYRVSLTPGGTAPAPVRALAAVQSGSQTPTRLTLRNLYTAPPEALTIAGSVAAGNIYAVDPVAQIVWTSAMTNVIGYWVPGADASGAITDFGTNSRDLTVTSAPTYRVDGPEFGAMDFDGADDVASSNSASFALTANIALCCWVYPDQVNPAAAAGIFGKGATTGNGGFSLWMETDNTFHFGVGSGAATRIASGVTTAQAGRWYHLCGVWNDSTDTAQLYVDGELEGQTSGAAFTVGGYSGDLRLGAAIPVDETTLRYWNGRVGGSCAVLNTTLTQQQVRLIRRYGLAGYNGTQQLALGQWPVVHGENTATTDTVEIRVTHATSAPTLRTALGWRAAYDV